MWICEHNANIIAVLLLTLNSLSSQGCIIECEFGNEEWINLGVVFQCKVNGMQVTSRESVTEVVGEAFRPLRDVKALDVQDERCQFIPSEVKAFFPNLEGLQVANSELKELQNVDMQQFPNLKQLFVSENELQSLENDVFEPCPKIEYINLGHNNIMHLGTDIFAPLKSLQYCNVVGNSCIDSKLESPNAIEVFSKAVEMQCPPTTEMLRREKERKLPESLRRKTSLTTLTVTPEFNNLKEELKKLKDLIAQHEQKIQEIKSKDEILPSSQEPQLQLQRTSYLQNPEGLQPQYQQFHNPQSQQLPIPKSQQPSPPSYQPQYFHSEYPQPQQNSQVLSILQTQETPNPQFQQPTSSQAEKPPNSLAIKQPYPHSHQSSNTQSQQSLKPQSQQHPGLQALQPPNLHFQQPPNSQIHQPPNSQTHQPPNSQTYQPPNSQTHQSQYTQSPQSQYPQIQYPQPQYPKPQQNTQERSVPALSHSKHSSTNNSAASDQEYLSFIENTQNPLSLQNPTIPQNLMNPHQSQHPPIMKMSNQCGTNGCSPVNQPTSSYKYSVTQPMNQNPTPLNVPQNSKQQQPDAKNSSSSVCGPHGCHPAESQPKTDTETIPSSSDPLLSAPLDEKHQSPIKGNTTPQNADIEPNKSPSSKNLPAEYNNCRLHDCQTKSEIAQPPEMSNSAAPKIDNPQNPNSSKPPFQNIDVELTNNDMLDTVDFTAADDSTTENYTENDTTEHNETTINQKLADKITDLIMENEKKDKEILKLLKKIQELEAKKWQHEKEIKGLKL